MEEQESRGWACVDKWQDVRQASRFCQNAIDYPFAVPQGGKTADQLVDADHKASLAFVSHLNGMGRDAWDHQEPWIDGTPACVQSVWRLVCYTYFPKCNVNNAFTYMRPCRSACEDYVSSCRIECCDEGVQCVFTHSQVLEDAGMVRFVLRPKATLITLDPACCARATRRILMPEETGPLGFSLFA